MFVYIGTLNYLHASNEAITVTFPAGFEVKDPVSAHWQWSKDPEFNGNKTSISRVRVFPAQCGVRVLTAL